MAMKTVLITGASGALGQAVVARLRRDDHTRLVLTSRNRQAENYFQLDICDREEIHSSIKSIEPDLVLHLAATFTDDFKNAYAVNVEATMGLLDAVRRSGCRTRVVLIGSAAEYGMVLPKENPVREDRALHPVSIYGLTKAWQTQLAAFYASCGVDVTTARVFNLDGPGLSERLFIGRLHKQIDDVLAGRKSVIEVGPLNATRDYISTEEAAAQILAIAELGESGRVYHVASGRPVSMRNLLIRYLSINNLDSSIVREAVNLTNRIGYDVQVIYADITSTMQLMRLRGAASVKT
jgi:nucleoside-diphosphate-sugar epimerase